MAIPESPLTRVEQFLHRIATGDGIIPDEPLTRIEQYLDYIVKNGSGGKSESLEEIITITGDGTKPTISQDKDGKPFALKKAVVKVTLGFDASASGNFTMTGVPDTGSSISLCNLYFSWSASAKAAWKGCGVVEQDCGFWRQMVSGVANNGYSQIYGNAAYSYVNSVDDFPAIQQFSFGGTLPVGTVIQILGVRA